MLQKDFASHVDDLINWEPYKGKRRLKRGQRELRGLRERTSESSFARLNESLEAVVAVPQDAGISHCITYNFELEVREVPHCASVTAFHDVTCHWAIFACIVCARKSEKRSPAAWKRSLAEYDTTGPSHSRPSVLSRRDWSRLHVLMSPEGCCKASSSLWIAVA